MPHAHLEFELEMVGFVDEDEAKAKKHGAIFDAENAVF